MAVGILSPNAIPAVAQTQVTFRVGGVGIEVTAPKGYCEPAGAGIDVAQFIAAADNENVTGLTLFPCDDHSGTAPDYYLIKTPKSALLNNAPRTELLATLRAEFEKPEFEAMMQSLDAPGE